MKVLHVVFAYPPDPVGGTEVYVEGLARSQAARGYDVIVAAPGVGEQAYDHDRIPVRRFACTTREASLDLVYGGGDPIASASFARLLDEVRPDLVHQHGLSPACSTDLVRLAKQRGRPVVFTYHTPTVTCQRGTLVYLGREACSGEVQLDRCTRCVLDHLSLNPVIRGIVASVPPDLGRAVGRRGLAGGVWTAMRMTALMETRVREVDHLLSLVDRFVAPSPWVVRVLEVNGVAADRIALSAHGVVSARADLSTHRDDGIVRLVHLGRLDPAKGTALLLRALSAVKTSAVALDVFGIAQGDGGAALGAELRAMAAADPRVRLLEPVPHDDVLARLATYDAVVVPSQAMETGPLVVLEAFAAGVPVIGSSLGGVADKVQDGVNGWLVSPFDGEDAWSAALRRSLEPGALRRLRASIVPPRSAEAVADDMDAVYASLIDRAAAALMP